MSEGTGELWGKSSSPDQKNDWGELVRLSTKIIELEQDLKKKAEAYYVRGRVRCVGGENELAIEDLTEAIKLESQHAFFYNYRGIAYKQQNNYDEALMDFRKAIEIDSKAWVYYSNRGIVYTIKGDYRRAFDDFNKAIKLNHKEAELYGNRGVIYYIEGDNDKAIQDLTKAIKLGSKNAHFFCVLGFTYIVKMNYLAGFENFIKADKCSHSIKYKYPQVYLASKIEFIYKTNIKTKNQIFVLCIELLHKIGLIRKKHFHVPCELYYAHYSSLHTLKKLVGKECFRLYNAKYMNDPEEGQVFLKMISKPEMNVKEIFYGEDIEKSYISPAYIGSFIMPEDAPEDSPKDSLPLWRTYGQHDDEEAAGVCVIFKPEHFAEISDMSFGSMQKLHSMPSTKPELYKVMYVDQKNNTDDSYFILLKEVLLKINDYINIDKNSVKSKALKKIVRELLDTIRFIFKANYYKEEKEVRIINFNYIDNSNQEPDGAKIDVEKIPLISEVMADNSSQESDRIKIDMESIPPRFYVETPERFRFNEVILGPRTKRIQEWKQWIKEHDENIVVEQSDIKYGRQDP